MIDLVLMPTVKKKYVVMSGKGGVGKSTVSVNLAVSLALQGKKVGLLDVDIHGPSIPTMLGLAGTKLTGSEESIDPVLVDGIPNLKVMSVGFLLESEDAPVIWRGPMKNSIIKQFLKDVTWGELDYLIIDCPPGTGDEPLSVVQLLGKADGTIIVTTPQDVASVDVSKSIKFAEQVKIPVTGIVENMSGFVCPHCNEVSYIFKEGGGKKLAEEYKVPFLGAIPIDPALGEAGDSGKPYVAQFKDSIISRTYEEMTKVL
ncbi:MAG TPA: Mrp/NBP35 family ATP-binding protein [Treponemataceae bacterium]|nr:Mrp/NBP35 family ATP-binding protein [Treponemataceae bacterium]HPM05859.1 Mrp/NBP35 family ATP-binding protein [Treponemataceae bacterium]HPY53415.1 Mrp/NBP35 family ATP-binding protein [Treponemataceae bacterium]HUH44280.1 Mrp/NBP35 family ATP-binding protein [Treponemataceae bacterium]